MLSRISLKAVFTSRNRQHYPLLCSFLATMALPLCSPLSANAGEITINDCNGITRAQIALAEQTEKKDLTVGIDGNATTVSKLVLKSSDITAVAEVNDREAYFSNLGSGVYEICPESGTAQLSSVHFHSTGSVQSTGSTIKGVAIGAAALAGSAIVIGSGNGGSSDSSPATVLSQVSATNGDPLAAPSLVKAPAAIRPDSEAARACLNGARLTPISPFE